MSVNSLVTKEAIPDFATRQGFETSQMYRQHSNSSLKWQCQVRNQCYGIVKKQQFTCPTTIEQKIYANIFRDKHQILLHKEGLKYFHFFKLTKIRLFYLICQKTSNFKGELPQPLFGIRSQ